MQYEVIKITNGDKTTDGSGTATIPCGIITGIVGNTYPQFIAGDTYNVIIVNYATKTGAEVDAEAVAQVNAFIAEKYPNT